jgi:hypothetical protein
MELNENEKTTSKLMGKIQDLIRILQVAFILFSVPVKYST